MDKNNNIDKVNNIKNKINIYFTNKYPTTYPILGLSDNNLEQLVNKVILSSEKNNKLQPNDKKNLLKQNINNLISLIERKIKLKIYSENRIKNTINTNQFTLDPNVDVSYNQSYINNFNPKDIVGQTNLEKSQYENNNSNNIKNIKYNNLDANDIEQLVKSFALDKNTDKLNINLTNSHLKEINELLNKDDNILKERIDDINLLYEEEREFNYNIVIDSKDRDYNKYSSPNNFVIDFSPPSGTSDEINTGYINRAFGNIISCELLSLLILDTSEEEDSSDTGNTKIPYLLLDIEELGYNYEGTNDNLSKSFAILTDYNLISGYKHYFINSIHNTQTIKKVYNPRININKMTIKLKNADGSLYNFGSSNDDNTNTVIKLLFRITTLQKNLSTKFINKATY